jgi:hypothetical protein
MGVFEMDEVRIKLAALWAAVMLTYLLGDVLRIFSGDVKPGEMKGMEMTQGLWLLISVIMLIPIVMMILSLILGHPASRWANIIAAVFVVIFNIAGLPYDSAFDNFLILVSFVFNAMTLWYAWTWV